MERKVKIGKKRRVAGGIGVREMALTLLLAPVMGRDKIVVLSVMHRLVTVLGDVLAYFLRHRFDDAR